MKLQKQKTHQVGNKQYFKYVIVVNEKLINALGWNEGDDLKAENKGGKLVIGKG